MAPLRFANVLLWLLTFQWIPELKHYAPGVPIVLVGTKLGQDHTYLFGFFVKLVALYIYIHTTMQVNCSLSFCFFRGGSNVYDSTICCLNLFGVVKSMPHQVSLINFYILFFDIKVILVLICTLDLRDDKQFFIDHPGAVPITTAQVGNKILNPTHTSV